MKNALSNDLRIIMLLVSLMLLAYDMRNDFKAAKSIIQSLGR